MNTSLTIRLRCDQNRLFGCGHVSRIPASLLTIGADGRRVMAYGPCEHCGLPLAAYRDATASEVASC